MLYAVQNYRNMNATIPKATSTSESNSPTDPGPDARAGSLDVGSGPSGGSLALALEGSEGRSNPKAEAVKS